MVLLNQLLTFPDPKNSDADGLVAVGGDLSPERLLVAYKNGIFPWETNPVIGWYSPDPRCVLVPSEVIISHSMRSLINSGKYSFKLNTSFSEVISSCQKTIRKGEAGTWISPELIDSFCVLHKNGYAYSAETWYNGKLVGGLYGMILGKVFFGESMFSSSPNASKFALIKFCNYLIKKNIFLIDCQVHSEHLETMGARLISRNNFIDILQKLI